MKTVSVTPRQYDVARLLYDSGFSNIEIAENLGLSVRTVESHLRTLYEVTNVKGDRELLVWMRKNRLIVENKTIKEKEERKESAINFYRKNFSVQAIAKILGVTDQCIYTYLKDL